MFIFSILQKLSFWRGDEQNRSFTRGTETEHYIKKTTNFCFQLIKKIKAVSKVVEQEIHFHGYETQAKSFEEEKKHY